MLQSHCVKPYLIWTLVHGVGVTVNLRSHTLGHILEYIESLTHTGTNTHALTILLYNYTSLRCLVWWWCSMLTLIFSVLTVMNLSRSYRDMVWKNPRAWPSSCAAVPTDSQPFPNDRFCCPPILPTYDQHPVFGNTIILSFAAMVWFSYSYSPKHLFYADP